MNNFDRDLGQYLGNDAAATLLAHKKTFIALDTSDELTTLTSSKIGGHGYLPLTIKYPVNRAGKPLALLAQINFSEMPTLAPFPDHGLLAFYVDYFDDLAGMSAQDRTKQDGFRVLYFDDTTAPAYPEHVLEVLFASIKSDDWLEIVSQEKRLTGKLAESVPFSESLEFEAATGDSFYTFGDRYPENIFGDLINALSFQNGIGCYPAFTQGDPRREISLYDTVLFQLDSNIETVRWGDNGIGNFFINSDQLQAKDFSDVIYTWDGY